MTNHLQDTELETMDPETQNETELENNRDNDTPEPPKDDMPEGVCETEQAQPETAAPEPPDEPENDQDNIATEPPENDQPDTPIAEVRPNIIRSKTKEYLKYIFTEEELREKAQEMARAVALKEQAEDKLKSLKKSIDSEIAAADANIRRCSEHLRSGYEYKNIECEKVLNFTSGTFMIIRIDTGEIVSHRGLRDEELQIRLV